MLLRGWSAIGLGQLLPRCCPKVAGGLIVRPFSSRPIKMATNEFGSGGTPLIIMHGLFGSKQNWRGVGRTLESKLKRQIITADARNHGESPHTSDHNSALMAADVAELMRTSGIPKASVMGHSMGGRTMMYFALKYPELVDRAIIVDISPISIPTSVSYMADILGTMATIDVPADLSMAEGRKVAEKQMSEVVDKSTLDFIMLNLKKRPSGEFYWMPNVPTLSKTMHTFRSFMEQIPNWKPYTGPVLFICGSQSSFFDPSSFPDIQKIFPNAQLECLDTGHLVHLEKPAEFINLVVKFLQ